MASLILFMGYGRSESETEFDYRHFKEPEAVVRCSINAVRTRRNLEDIIAVRERIELETCHETWSQTILDTSNKGQLEIKNLSDIAA